MSTDLPPSHDDSRERTRSKVLGMPGVSQVRRPATDLAPAFDLAYVRSGPRGTTPIVVIPGGPGLASIMPYASMRKRAAATGLDVIMVEHRGIGASRTDLGGNDLGAEALQIPAVVDDIAAVLDDQGIERAVIYGSSYGSYLAQAFGASHPDRVASMVLDSTVLDAYGHLAVREHARAVLWRGEDPQVAPLARKVRVLAHSGAVDVDDLGQTVRIAYEFGGPDLAEGLLDQFVRGRAWRTWGWISQLARGDTERVVPFVGEFDLVGVIAFRDLNYGPEPDGEPFDPAVGFVETAGRYPDFAGEPFDLRAALPAFDWPVVLLSGERDVRTPRSVAAEVAGLIRGGVLVPLPESGHSALDTHVLAALQAMRASRDGEHRILDSEELGALPRRGHSRHVATMIRAALATERLNPRRRPPRAGQR